MFKFYNFKEISVIEYISIIVILLIAYSCGGILNLFWGIIFSFLPFIIVFVASIWYIKESIENKKIYIFCFCFIMFILSFFIGYKMNNYKDEKSKYYLINIGNIIEEHKQKNSIEILTEKDILNINLPKDIRIELSDENYIIYKKNYRYDSNTKEAMDYFKR
jgi:hypothetical protein